MSDLRFVILYAADVARSRAFDADILGRDALEASPGFAMFEAAPGVKLGLWRADEVKPQANRSGGAELCVTVDSGADVDRFAAVEQAGRGRPVSDANGFRLHIRRRRPRWASASGLRAGGLKLVPFHCRGGRLRPSATSGGVGNAKKSAALSHVTPQNGSRLARAFALSWPWTAASPNLLMDLRHSWV